MMLAKHGFNVNPDVWEVFTISLLTLFANDLSKTVAGRGKK
jgi:hypothetical protein